MNESIWYIELESAFCLLIGRLISYGIISSPLCTSEICNGRWLKSKLFSSGIEKLEDKSIFGKNLKLNFELILMYIKDLPLAQTILFVSNKLKYFF